METQQTQQSSQWGQDPKTDPSWAQQASPGLQMDTFSTENMTEEDKKIKAMSSKINEWSEVDQLREKVLDEKQKKEKSYHSQKFEEIRLEVKELITRQKADDALKVIDLGALSIWSSDIHYECNEYDVQIRYRIDGILVDIFSLEKKEYKLISERLKYSSSLKLNITDIPQDGKYSFKDWEKKYDIRVSTLPISYGENIVCRVLDSSKSIVDFKDLGFLWTSKRMIERALKRRQWMILVTWPTWSGKTTTLYTMVANLNQRSKKIITLEDPIEYELEGIIQSEVDVKRWYTYEVWLKALMRQDPDIIMIWEIRDYPVLNTTTQASLTWHLALATLHTKSAADTISRIINMWLKPYIIASSIDTILAQRLVRRICKNCKVEAEKSNEEVRLIEAMMWELWMKKIPVNDLKLFKWEWCKECNNSGYKWRIWIYEIITFDKEIRMLIREWGTAEEIIEKARKLHDMISIKEDGILKAMKWDTTIEEVLRVI